MCRSRPGPRCASHARQTLQRAIQMEESVRGLVNQGKLSQKTLESSIRDRILAQLEYDSTPTGQRELQEIIQTTVDIDARDQLNERLKQALMYRQSMITCEELYHSARERLDKAQALLKDQEAHRALLRSALVSVDRELKDKAAHLETLHEQQTLLQERISQIYFAQGKDDYARLPSLWIRDSNLNPKLRQQWMKINADIQSATKVFEQAQRDRGRAYARYHISDLNVRMTRAEIASGLKREGDSSMFTYHGQAFINEDGSTNVRLLTKIPYTNTEIFARVRTLTDDYVILETGTTVPLRSRIAPSNWRFDPPSPGSIRGPQIFMMQSSIES